MVTAISEEDDACGLNADGGSTELVYRVATVWL
jgi:hypothetical protein